MITVLFDTETDGLITNSMMKPSARPRIMEIFALKIEMIGNSGDGYEFVERGKLNLMFNIGRAVPDEVTQITGIKSADLVNKPEFVAKAEEVMCFLEDAHRVVAHNLTYDVSVVEFECERFNVRKPNWPEKVCTVEATEHLKGYRLKLVDLHTELFGEPFTGAHRAETDVRAMARCYEELVRRNEI